MGKKECPTCRKPVATKRNLRKDTNFQDMITKLYPDLEDFEEEEDRLISNVATRARMVAMTAEQLGAPRRSPLPYTSTFVSCCTIPRCLRPGRQRGM